MACQSQGREKFKLNIGYAQARLMMYLNHDLKVCPQEIDNSLHIKQDCISRDNSQEDTHQQGLEIPCGQRAGVETGVCRRGSKKMARDLDSAQLLQRTRRGKISKQDMASRGLTGDTRAGEDSWQKLLSLLPSLFLLPSSSLPLSLSFFSLPHVPA